MSRQLICILFTLTISYGSSKTLTKRRLDMFAEMIDIQAKGLHAFDVNNYGGWCGIGGSGDPVDGLDRCCMHHDLCYSALREDACTSIHQVKIYALSYEWSHVNGEVVCNDDPVKEACRYQLCKCDKHGSKCFGENAHEFTPTHKSNSTFAAISNYVIKAFMHGKWVPDTTWEGFDNLMSKIQTKQWDIIQEHIPDKYWVNLAQILPKKYIPDNVKEKLQQQQLGGDGIDSLNPGDLGSGDQGTEQPGTDTGEKSESWWIRFKEWISSLG